MVVVGGERDWLFHSGGENLFVANLNFDPQRRPQVGALHDGTAHPYASRNIHHLERIIHRPAARIADHGVLGIAESIIGLKLLPIGDVLEAATSGRRTERKCPIARRSAAGTGWQANQYSRDGFSAEAILVEEVLRRPRLR